MSRDPDNEITDDEIRFSNEIEKKVQEINKKFKGLGIKEGQIANQESQGLGMTMNPKQNEQFDKIIKFRESMPVIDRSGREVLTNVQIHDRYNSSWYPYCYTQLPVCWHSYKSKLQFTAPWTFFMAYAYVAKQTLQSGKKLREMSTKATLLSWLVLYTGSFIVCTIDSIYFDEYCDINSYHYNQNQNRKSILRDLRSKKFQFLMYIDRIKPNE